MLNSLCLFVVEICPQIVHLLFRYIWYERLAEEFRSKIHIFSSFFHTRLKDASRDNKELKCVDVILYTIMIFGGGVNL